MVLLGASWYLFITIYPPDAPAAAVQALPGGLHAGAAEPGAGQGAAAAHDRVHLRVREGQPRPHQVEGQDALPGE